MSAKDMFEELGMETENTSCLGIEYHFKNDMDYPYGYYGYIYFDDAKKEFLTNIVDTSKYQQAINKQIEELGWNKED